MDILPPFKRLVPSFTDGTPLEVRLQTYHDGPAVVIKQGPDVVVFPVGEISTLALALLEAQQATE